MPYLNNTCNSTSVTWNTTFHFGTSWDSIILSNQFLMFDHSEYTGIWPDYYAYRCYIYLENIGASSTAAIGEVFFMQFYSVFDSDNQRIGFANHAANSTMISQYGPWFTTDIAPTPGVSNYTIPMQQVEQLIFVADVSLGN